MVIYLERGANLHMAQLMPLPLSVSCSSKIQICLPFWYRLTRVVLDKGPLSGCVCVSHQLLEAETVRAIFLDNKPLCAEVSTAVIQQFVRAAARHRHQQYIRLLQAIIKPKGSLIRKCQDMVMTEVMLCTANLAYIAAHRHVCCLVQSNLLNWTALGRDHE